MPTARATRVNSHGWAIRLEFLGRTLIQEGRRDPAPLSAGEQPGCDVVIPGLGARILLTDGPHLLLPPGLEGEVTVGGEVRPVEALREAGGRVLFAPGDGADLRVAAHPGIGLSIRRVTLDRLPWSARISGRDLARQLVTGAALVGMLAMLWRVEHVENVLKLKGDPTALEDSALHRIMFFTPVEEPIEVVRARELFAPVVLPPPPPPTPPAPAAEPGVDVVSTSPAPLALLAEGAVPVPEVQGELVEAPKEIAKVRSKKERRSRRSRDAEVFGVLGALKTDEGSISALYGTFEDSAVLGGVEGGVVGGILGSVDSVDSVDNAKAFGVGTLAIGSVAVDEPLPPPSAVVAPVLVDMAHEPGKPHPTGGLSSHDAQGSEATRGALDGVAAVAVAATCDDPTISRKQQIDIVFAVDVSTTMNFMLGKIEQEIAAVDAAARAQGLDARYGLVVFVDDVKVANGGKPYDDLAALQRDLAAWQAFTASNRQILGEAANLDWPENTLDALHAAATEFAWRPAATTLRTIVHATDDDFGEPPAVQSGQAIKHTYRQTVDALRAAEVRVFSFAARVGGQCECLDVRAGLYTDYRGQKAIPAATGGAVFDIDEVAAGRLNFGQALSGALQTAICTHYPLAPFGARKK